MTGARRRASSARLLGCGLGVDGDAVLAAEVVELVRRPARLDQVREQQRVLRRLDAQRLRVVRDQGT
jgi:hypothetical protein